MTELQTSSSEQRAIREPIRPEIYHRATELYDLLMTIDTVAEFTETHEQLEELMQAMGDKSLYYIHKDPKNSKPRQKNSSIQLTNSQ